MIYRRSFIRLFALLFMFSMLCSLIGCSRDDYSCNTVYTTNCTCTSPKDKTYHIFYQFSQETVAKAVDAGAKYVDGFAYDDNGNIDSTFALKHQEIAKMDKADNGDYLAELIVNGASKHVDLYFYYENGDEKLATNGKYFSLDFASETKDHDIIIDCDANDVYITIKTYDNTGRETSNFAPGDKIFTKVFLTCQGENCFFAPIGGNSDRTFSVSEIISNDTEVADISSQKDDNYVLFDALANGTANLYVKNLDFTCLFSEHGINVGNDVPDYTAIYLAPEGYTVSEDGTKVLDPNGREVNVANLPDAQVIAAGGTHTFVAIGAKDDGTAAATYELLGNEADAVLDTTSQNINNDGFKVIVAEEATADDQASISATYRELTSNVINITVEAEDDFTAIYLVPEGYTVSDDGTKILDPNGEEVDTADLPDTQAIAAGESHTFVAIGAKDDGTAVTYALLGNAAEAVLETESQNISNNGFAVTVAAEAVATDEATISAKYGTLTSNVINITVEVPSAYNALYVVPWGYDPSDDGTEIRDPYDHPIDPADLPTDTTIEYGTTYPFRVIGAREDDTGTTIYEFVTDTVTAELTTESDKMTNENFRVSAARNASEDDTATLKAVDGNLKSNAMTIKAVPFRAIYVCDGRWVLSDDGSKLYDPNYPEDPDDWDFVGFVYDDFLMGVNFGIGAFKGNDVSFQLIAVDTVEGKLKRIPVKVNPGDDGAEMLLSGDTDDASLNLSASSVHINNDATSGELVYVDTAYKGLESEVGSFIITIH
ncbi:MAG: hypothetical protein K6G50_05775 [bacterium]|nr:hypothetical protein [bacterium]